MPVQGVRDGSKTGYLLRHFWGPQWIQPKRKQAEPRFPDASAQFVGVLAHPVNQKVRPEDGLGTQLELTARLEGDHPFCRQRLFTHRCANLVNVDSSQGVRRVQDEPLDLYTDPRIRRVLGSRHRLEGGANLFFHLFRG